MAFQSVNQRSNVQFQPTLTPRTDVKVKAKCAAEMFWEFRVTLPCEGAP